MLLLKAVKSEQRATHAGTGGGQSYTRLTQTVPPICTKLTDIVIIEGASTAALYCLAFIWNHEVQKYSKFPFQKCLITRGKTIVILCLPVISPHKWQSNEQ